MLPGDDTVGNSKIPEENSQREFPKIKNTPAPPKSLGILKFSNLEFLNLKFLNLKFLILEFLKSRIPKA